MMKEVIKKEEVAKLNRYGAIYGALLIVSVVLLVPLVTTLGMWGWILWGIIYGITMCVALKIEKIKKNNDIQTYKEIVAFSQGKGLDEIQKQREIGKRPYQKILLVLGTAVVTFAVCLLIGFMMHFFMN